MSKYQCKILSLYTGNLQVHACVVLPEASSNTNTIGNSPAYHRPEPTCRTYKQSTSGISRGAILRWAMQLLSVSEQRGNAEMYRRCGLVILREQGLLYMLVRFSTVWLLPFTLL